MKIKKEITRGLGAVSACLLTVVSIGTPVAEAYEGRLNTVLGIETTKTVSDEGLDVDTDYYKSDYGTDIYDGDKLQQLEDDAHQGAGCEEHGHRLSSSIQISQDVQGPVGDAHVGKHGDSLKQHQHPPTEP